MTEKIDVLDHGFVRLVDHMGNDLSIVRNARVSYDADWRTGEDSGSDTKLINYLYKSGHNTPFEAVTFTFDVKAPIFVLRQWMRHRTQSFNELSARYRELPAEYYVPDPSTIGVQSADNKQMRNFNGLNNPAASDLIDKANAISYENYQRLLDTGVPREIARTVLPVGMYSHMFCTVNLNNLFKFLSERLHTHAQYEIRMYAEAILKLIREIAPVAVKAFEGGLNRG